MTLGALGRIVVVSLLGLVPAIIVLGALEIAFRQRFESETLFQGAIQHFFVLDPITLVEVRPNLSHDRPIIVGGKPFPVTTNADGLRDRAVRERRPDVVRVLAIGTSFTFGWGVGDDESWPAQLEQVLRERKSLPFEVEVVNGGANGLIDPFKRYLSRLSRYNPDIVVMETRANFPSPAIDLDKDRLDTYLNPVRDFPEGLPYYIDDNGYLRRHIFDSPLLRQLSRASALFRQISVRVLRTHENRAQRDLASDPEWLRSVKLFHDQPIEAVNHILNVDRFLAHDDVAFLALLWRGVPERWWQDIPGPTPNAKAVANLAAASVPALDLLPVLDRTVMPQAFIEDGHWSAAGNRLVAESVATLLETHKDQVLAHLRRRAERGLVELDRERLAADSARDVSTGENGER
ncbi:hypothetical protein [Magnetospirillum sp. UT-4]|uniref:hypothetical protein n=1 Tax=Magnetospirillum sp. UT-4 TaxID=2681467 RepID=UPI00137C4C90|nr:hypothetical protein [Magnetospirillum sp. UT-4]CAA7612118.1 hypothetical protein MTBUT4_110047 [Magnetospirillum sp. UT-4]